MSKEWNTNRNSKADFKIGDAFNRASQNSNSVLPSDDGEEKLDTRLLYDFKQEIAISWIFLFK